MQININNLQEKMSIRNHNQARKDGLKHYCVKLWLYYSEVINLRRKYIISLSFIIAFAGFPFKWIQYKGTQSISILQISEVNPFHLFIPPDFY